ncbi:arrestin domain-containing protein 3-like [Haliotis asinina]|uniref:arrestin domain-containing protein 3-like n=1 Tax=Haliotis asinina TaxID=109174 RepID=UPI00353222E3
MGKLNSFVIVFSQTQDIYYPGQTIRGHVTVDLNDTMKMRGIRLRFEGKAKVEWEEGSGDNEKHYSAKEKYFKDDILLDGRGSEASGAELHLAAGLHTYPFTYQLPEQIPSSFEAKYGNVRYFAKCIIDKPWKFDHETMKPFTVIYPLDLNEDESALMPVKESNSKTVGCLCCESGPINATFAIDRQGYVPGEAIILKAEIDNMSNGQIESSSVTLTMETTFRVKHKTKYKQNKVAKLKHGSILMGEHDYWNGDQLVIPPLPPSYLRCCSIIDVKYILMLTVRPPGLAFDLNIQLPVIIGTIPLQSVIDSHPAIMHPAASSSFPPSAYPPGETPPTDTFSPGAGFASPVYPQQRSALPPSYEECVFGKVNISEEGDSKYLQGVTEYAPAYAYYDWGHKPTGLPD